MASVKALELKPTCLQSGNAIFSLAAPNDVANVFLGGTSGNFLYDLRNKLLVNHLARYTEELDLRHHITEVATTRSGSNCNQESAPRFRQCIYVFDPIIINSRTAE